MKINRFAHSGLMGILLCAGQCFAQNGLPFAKGTVRIEGHKSSCRLPMKFEGGHIYVVTYVGKEGPFYFALDTGSSVSTMIPALATALKLRPRKLHGDPRYPYVDVPLKYPGLEIEWQRFYNLTDANPGGAPAILGYDFIRQFVLEIDYPHKQVVLHDRRKFGQPEPNDGGWEVVPLTLARNCPQIVVQLNYLGGASESARALIDTGANTSVLFTPGMSKRIGEHLITNIQIGRFLIRPVACCPLVPIYPLNEPPFPYDVFLPGPEFGGARLILDFEHKNLYLRID
jgi:hypothetical protein